LPVAVAEGEEEGARRSTRRRRQSFLVVVVVLLLLSLVVLPLLIAMAFYSSLGLVAAGSTPFKFATNQQQPLGFTILTRTVNESSVTTTTIVNETPFFQFPSLDFLPRLPTIPTSLLIALVVAIFLLVSLGLVRNMRRRGAAIAGFDSNTSPKEEDEKKKKAEELAQILDDAVQKLRQGDAYRETVLECYKRVTALIYESAGPSVKESSASMTPREFEKAAEEKLKIQGGEGSSLFRVTLLFEKARYSNHPVSREEADIAVDCLSDLSSTLKKNPSEGGTGQDGFLLETKVDSH
jgi:hypothetical protein